MPGTTVLWTTRARNATVALAAVLLASVAAGQGAAAPDPAQTQPTVAITGVVGEGTPVQLVRAGFDGTEGLIGLPDGTVVFCEFNKNRIVRIDAQGGISTYLEDTNRPIGLGIDHKGRLIAAESRDPRIAVVSPERKTLADSYGGQPLVRPNDMVIDRRNGIYFTDPLPSPQLQFRDPPPGRKPLLLYIRPDGKVVQVTDLVTQPNGIQLSIDEKTLYAVDGDHLMAFDVQRDGSVKNPRLFADVTGDGLTLDAAGRLFVATAEGIRVFDASGHALGLIATPVGIQSTAFGGADRSTLYAVGRGAAYRIATLTRGPRTRAK
jgi:gluconolactonase